MPAAVSSAAPSTRRHMPPRSFAADVRRLDDRPPLLDLGFLQVGERLRRALRRLGDFLAEIGEALAAFQKAEIEKWWPIIKAAGIKVE